MENRKSNARKLYEEHPAGKKWEHVDIGMNFIANIDILVKSPDASPLDFFSFGYLKQRLFKRRPTTMDGLWKATNEEWSTITQEKVKKVFASWKFRCRLIVKMEGKHIEQSKQIHSRKLSV